MEHYSFQAFPHIFPSDTSVPEMQIRGCSHGTSLQPSALTWTLQLCWEDILSSPETTAQLGGELEVSAEFTFPLPTPALSQ